MVKLENRYVIGFYDLLCMHFVTCIIWNFHHPTGSLCMVFFFSFSWHSKT
uniref:Uncharacterized protein n=1 Tax=Manihot esculenta TaxID=3983 RepID=A0A2C9VQ04_MANES